MKRNQSRISSKALSTIPSIGEVAQPRIHSYHQYETLLNFITSFITDFRFHVNELKELVYHVVGVDPNLLKTSENSAKNIECEYCQVEYIINSCKNCRNDMVRIISILRGCSNFMESDIQISKIEDERKERVSFHENVEDSNNFQEITLMNLKKEEKKEIVIGACNMGMLTFRELSVSRQDDIESRNWSSRFKIIEQNNETSRSNENSSRMLENLSQKICQQNPKSILKNSKCKNQFQKAYLLIKLMKQEIPNVQVSDFSHIRNFKDNLDVVIEEPMSENTIKAK